MTTTTLCYIENDNKYLMLHRVKKKNDMNEGKWIGVGGDEEGEFVPKIKISENTEKITNPGNKTIYRIYEKASGKIKADLICFADEVIDPKQDLLLFDPMDTWKKTKLAGGTYTVREILLPIFKNGECLYKSPTLKEIAAYCREEKDTLWDETKRLFYPHRVYVDLSQKLYAVKQSLLDQMTMTD